MKLRVAQYVMCKDFLFFFVIFSPLYIDASILVCAITPSQNKQTAKCKKKRKDKKKKMNGLLFSSSLLRLLMCAADVHTHTVNKNQKMRQVMQSLFFHIKEQPFLFLFLKKEKKKEY
jgi:hypothetical protein